MAQRVWHSFFRFLVASEIHCETSRGRTRLNGSHAHCKCQAAHASLTPTLYDDKLPKVLIEIKEKGYTILSPQSKQYIDHRLNIKTPDRVILSENSEYLICLQQRLTILQKRGSYIDTDVEKQRNSTIQNPTCANRLDSHLEHTLRPLEDTLAEECTKHVQTPESATQLLTKKHIELLDTCIRNIQTRRCDFEHLLKTHKKLQDLKTELDTSDCPATKEKLYYSFASCTKDFLSLRTALLKSMPGALHFNDFFKSFFLKEGTFYRLKQIEKTAKEGTLDPQALIFYDAIKDSLDLSQDDESIHFMRTEIDNRQLEAEGQRAELLRQNEMITQLKKLNFGKVDETGKLRTPTKAEILDALIEGMYRPTTPKKRISASTEIELSRKRQKPLEPNEGQKHLKPKRLKY